MNHALRNFFTLIAALAVPLVLGCASSGPPAPDESLLSKAGFKVVTAKTPEQQDHLRSLTPGKVSAMERNGVPFYVYPDAARNQIYVGTLREFQAYQRLQPGIVDPHTELRAQQAADRASSTKQDSAMRKETQRDLADPYYFWPSFADIVWVF